MSAYHSIWTHLGRRQLHTWILATLLDLVREQVRLKRRIELGLQKGKEEVEEVDSMGIYTRTMSVIASKDGRMNIQQTSIPRQRREYRR